MDIILADRVPSPSGSPVDGGRRTAQSAASPHSSDSRRSFSTVLQGVDGEERKGETREADDTELRSKEAKRVNPSSTERTATSPSQAQAEDESRAGGDENRAAEEDSRKAPESTNQLIHAHSDSQGQPPAPLLPPILLQVPARLNDQTKAHMEGEGHVTEENRVAEGETESDRGSSTFQSIVPRAANLPTIVSDPEEGRSSPDNDGSSHHGPPAHEPDSRVIRTTRDVQTAQAVKPTHMVADIAGTELANHVETRSVLLESQSGSALPPHEAIVSRASHTLLGAGLPDGKPERDDVAVDRSAPAQMNWYASTLRNDQNIGVRMRWALPQGQQSGLEGAERVSEFWDEQSSRQHDQAEVKLPRAGVADRHVSSGQPTEAIMAGAHRDVASGPMHALAPPFVSHAHPAMPIYDPDQQSVRFMTRSVVFDLTQHDLGHVNIRVAMMNDVVHTHVLTDRPEVGQFLINGQDRLQAAFQANGLDMGQFRVDIDRQSAGRSFHHGPSQEQGQSWNQGSPEMNWGQGQDRQHEPRPPLHGLLNVVA